jgi:hypothetical protein
MTEFDFTAQFADLSDVAARLNAESDTINQLIDQLQEKLRALNIGLDAWILLRSEPGSALASGAPMLGKLRIQTTVRVETSLGYARGVDGWGLYIKRISYRAKPSSPFIPEEPDPVTVNKWLKLSEASRAVRIDALRAFPKLLEKLKAAAAAAVDAIEQAKKFVR